MLWNAQRCAVHAKAHIRTNISSALSTSSAEPTGGPELPPDILNHDHRGCNSTHCPIVFPAAHCPTRVRAHRLLFTRTAPTYSIFKTRAPVKRTPNLLTYSSISTRCPTCQSFREPVPQKRISRLSVGSSRYTGVRHPFVDVSDRKTKV
jgi:hypothetical protein